MVRKLSIFIFVIVILAPVLFTYAQQSTKVPRIGYLTGATRDGQSARIESFRQGLRELGYVEGKNIVIEYRYAEEKQDRLSTLAAELVRLKVDVIVTGGGGNTRAAKEATNTIPIVMAQDSDPVGNGFVASLALNVKLQYLGVLGPKDIETAFRAATKASADAVLVLPGPIFNSNRSQIAKLAAKSRLPAIYSHSRYVIDGGLMTYGVNQTDLDRRAATYVDKILKGAKPADLPVEQPTKFEFIVNLKAAKQIGLTIPPNVLLRADRVIR
jgi:putative tryptophan/tyrosine transport system substrate-binding protein